VHLDYSTNLTTELCKLGHLGEKKMISSNVWLSKYLVV